MYNVHWTHSLHCFEFVELTLKLGPYIETLGGLKSETTNQRLYHIVNGTMEDITYRFLPHHSKKNS